MKTFLHSRHPVLIVSALAVAAVIAWGILWTVAATQYSATIDGWIKSGRDAGYKITYDSRTRFGFPFHVVLRFVNLHWQDTDGIVFTAPTIDIGALPWIWREFDAKFKSHTELDAPLDAENHGLVLAGESGIAHVRLADDGTWIYSRVDIDRAALGRSPDLMLHADTLLASVNRPKLPPAGNKDIGLTVSGEAGNVALPSGMKSPFGSRMAKLKIDMRVMGPMPDFRLRDSVAAWDRNMGTVEFDTLDMDWGPLQLASKGTMGFDDDLQPEGAFASTVADVKPVVQALMAAGFIAERQQGMLDEAMHLFAKPAHADGVDGVGVPITVQLGGLFLGPVKVFSFPQIVWPGSPENPPALPSTLAAPLPDSIVGTSVPLGSTVPVGTGVPAGTTAPSVP